MRTAEHEGASLRVSGLTVGYGGGAVLHDVDLSVAPGEVLALLGANGAGKTTLMGALTGRVHATSGAIYFDGRDIASLSTPQRARAGIALVPDGQSVVAELTVEENLRLGALWRHRGPARVRAINQVFEMFEPIDRRRSAKGHELSGGERQMLALGRALVAEPKLIALDEPSLGLAPVMVTRIMTTLREAARGRGLTVLLAEQNATGALSVADRAVILNVGHVVADAPVDQIVGDPTLRHAYLGF